VIVRHVTKGQARDTGLAAVLILLLIAHFKDSTALVLPAMLVLVVDMAWPNFFRPAAYIWFTFANILRKIVSTILISVVFLVIATPIGLVRRLIGADPMQVGQWKKGSTSVFVDRDHLYTKQDLERPY
jgi:ABC-type phosphate/phosphonate transport system permease subunit